MSRLGPGKKDTNKGSAQTKSQKASKYTQQADLKKAIRDIRLKKCSVEEAADIYNIPANIISTRISKVVSCLRLWHFLMFKLKLLEDENDKNCPRLYFSLQL